MAHDRLGLPLSTSKEAAEAYVAGVDRMLASWPGAGEQLEQALQRDPEFALGHAAMTRFAQMDVQVGDVESALARFRERMRPAVSQSPPINVMTDGASLLWRIMLYEDYSPRSLPWSELARFGAPQV